MAPRLNRVRNFVAGAVAAYVAMTPLTSILTDRMDRAAPLVASPALEPLAQSAARLSSAFSAISALAPCTEPQRCGKMLARSDAEASLCAPLVEPVFVGAAPRAWAAKYSRDARALVPAPRPQIAHSVDRDRLAACAAARAEPFEAQLLEVVADALRTTGENEVIFTVLDASYADMLFDVHAMMERLDGAKALIFVSLDGGTSDLACCAGYRVATLALDSIGANEATKKDTVYLGKYYTAMLLCAAKVRFFFFEMDVWMPPRGGASVIDVFRAAAASLNGGDHPGASFVLHEDNPYTINAGLYYIRPDVDEGSYELFATIMSYARRHPWVFDQGLMNCVLKKMSLKRELGFIRDRDNCDEHGVLMRDASIVELVGNARARGGFNYTLVEATVAASYSTPFITRDTLAVHVLTSAPLTSSRGKKVVAKEMMLWEGSTGCYYCVGAGHDGEPACARRYIALESALAAPSGADDPSELIARLNELVAIARATGRTVVLPPVYHLARRFPSWELVDTVTIEEVLGEDSWREGTFFENPRLRVAENATVARVALGITAVAAQGLYPSAKAPTWFKARENSTHSERLRLLVAAALEFPAARDADVLFVSLAERRGRAIAPAKTPFEGRYFGDDLRDVDFSEPWLAELRFRSLRWCVYRHREKRRASLFAAHLDCGTQLDAEKATAAKLREKRQKRVAARKAAEALESGRAEADRSLDASADDATATPVDLDERDPETDRSAPPMLTAIGRERHSRVFAERLRERASIHLDTPPKTPGTGDTEQRIFGIIPRDIRALKDDSPDD